MSATKSSSLALAVMIVVAEPALALNCAKAEAREFYQSDCGQPATWFRAPFKEPCHSLVERAFPPHSDSEGTGGRETPTTTTTISANGTTSNVAAQSSAWNLGELSS
jgi:hypothetical protein